MTMGVRKKSVGREGYVKLMQDEKKIGKNPIWNEKFVFEVYDLQSEQLVLIVKNKNFADE